MRNAATGNGHAGKWISERRDPSADFQQLFGHGQAQLISLALAVDTDNTGEPPTPALPTFIWSAATALPETLNTLNAVQCGLRCAKPDFFGIKTMHDIVKTTTDANCSTPTT